MTDTATLRLPEAEALRETIAMILDGACPLQPANATDLVTLPGTAYGALLRTDDGEAVGAILADTATTVFLGGNLIMIPPAAQQDQYRQGRPEESVLDAMAEVVNMLRSTVNQVPGNPHVAPDPLRPLAELAAAEPWLTSPASRLDLAGPLPFGEGHLTLLAR